ncbi:chorismate mutase [Neocallimastix lanati (nom. inval.)]|uniref:Chorismate mutase n=1 Tax=Neocallimastix californiae TaxID=1754190 RepID=A0A1Y2APN9_9FUNG|nr:chorismate mutase [Neocallimastix sp. JGI-2020a]ORY24533.1 chorismate mutase [Neocallimastix californiae]|eukprot:ORY24533.1 chorismate mutase [Neocallimastix californiae]
MDCHSLEEVRSSIDRIDDEIIKKIAERKFYVSQASKFKKNEQGVKAPNRVEQVIQKVRAKAETYGAPPDLVESLYRNMIAGFVQMEMDEFKQHQQQQQQ